MQKLSSAVLFCFAATALVQAQPSRITSRIDSSHRTALTGHIHPRTSSANDMGRVSPSLKMSSVTLALTQTDAQKADLEKLIAEQQTPGSANYQKWLTPEQFAERFGASDADLAKMTAWLQSQGLTVDNVARSRTAIRVSGSAAQVEAAFKTELHYYEVDGVTHVANATEPAVPTAFASVVKGIHGLNDFRMKPAKRAASPSVQPRYDSSHGSHYLAPDDLATLYNIAPLYAAGIDGTGQKLVIAGQTQIQLSDLQTFRSSYNLPAKDPQVLLVPGTKDPGISKDDLDEAHLDIEWSGATARNAQIIYVYSTDVMDAVTYAIDQNLAPVLSTSYGLCELEWARSDASFMRGVAQQGIAQGITWFSASGDSGGADCGDTQNPGLSVDLPASIPEVTGVGGTEFSEGTLAFWATTNSTNKNSVLSYIPETTWNDSALDGQPASGGGGASIYFSKPSWQSVPGVPSDNVRHVPDIAMSASADHDGYLVYTSGALSVYGGTSVPTPIFAGIAALLNHYRTSQGGNAGLGNINPTLYSLSQTNPSIFHDITSGNNIVTIACPTRSRTCVATPVGFSAGVGYDQVTGLGSVDAYRLVEGFNGGSIPVQTSQTTLTLLSNLSNLASTDVTYLVATVTSNSGTTPAGSVTFSAGTTTLGQAVLVGSAGTATATLAVNGAQIPAGGGTITASYTDSSSASTTATFGVTVSGNGTGAKPILTTTANGASFKSTVAPGSILSIFGSQLAPSAQSASSVPLPLSMAGVAVLINGQAAPLYYVSSSQLNVQIPYEIAPNSTVTISVNNNGQVSTRSVAVSSAAPGVFTDASGNLVPTASATRGQEIVLYLTGAGPVSPAVPTGSAPASGTAVASLPRPQQALTVTVAGVQANVDFAGIPSGLVGVMQVNFFVPASVNAGAQPVVVSLGGVPSASATLTIVN